MKCEHCGKEDLADMNDGFFWCWICDKFMWIASK